MLVSIVIPTYNEKKNIEFLIKKISKVLKKFIFEIIVVDDNSKDGTINILRKIKSKNKKFNYFIRKKVDRDLSKSVIFGISKTRYKNIVIMDGDLQHNPKYLPKIFQIFLKQDLDFLVCCRSFEKRYGLSLIRYYSSKLLITLINFLLGKKVSDPMSGFFIFKKKIFIKNQFKLFRRGYKILLDLLYSDTSIKKIYDVEIKFATRKKGKSKMSTKILFLLINMILFKIYARFI